MGAHAEAVRNRLEMFLLFVDAVAASPPPRLVYERSMRRIHQADNAVVDADGHVRGEIGEFVFRAEFFYLRRGCWSLLGLCESCSLRPGLGNVDPDETVPFLAGMAAGVDAIESQLLIGGQ